MLNVTPVIGFLLAANAIMFALEGLLGGRALELLALWPLSGDSPFLQGSLFAPWQLLTYAFLHDGLTHLFFNMLSLWMFGTQLESHWGGRRFALYYLFCVVGAGLLQLAVASNTGEIYPTIGASGGVYGVLLAFGMTFPEQRLMLLIPPVPVKAKWMVVGYGAVELWLGLSGSMPGVAHFAHLGGMLFGLLLILYWRGRLPIKPRRRMY